MFKSRGTLFFLRKCINKLEFYNVIISSWFLGNGKIFLSSAKHEHSWMRCFVEIREMLQNSYIGFGSFFIHCTWTMFVDPIIIHEHSYFEFFRFIGLGPCRYT